MKILSFLSLRIFVVFLVISSGVFANKTEVLKLKSGNYNLVPNMNSIANTDLAPSQYDNHFYVLVHFKSIPTQETKNDLTASGVYLSDYLPENSFLARISNQTDLSALAKFGVDGIYLISTEFKMSYALVHEEYSAHARKGNDIKIIVQTHDNNDVILEQLFRGVGATTIGSYAYSNLTTIQVPISNIRLLANHPLVKYMEEIAPDPVKEDTDGESNHRMNYISNPAINSIPYNGAGVWVAVGDDGQIGPHIDFTGRLDQVLASPGTAGDDHGDHVAGIQMGAGNLDPNARGMAWGADLKLYDVWDAVNSTPTSYFNPGVVVTSTSYGDGCNAGYTSFAQTADQQIRLMPNLMHVFSAGNSGTSNCGYGAGSGWGNITGGIKSGKNVLAVGNVTVTDQLASSSSRGPASDGRIKPDICANGSGVYSTLPDNTYGPKTGTSMSAPGVSGAYGAFVHAYRELNNGVTPSSDLVKGAMLNTADDLGNVGPDFRFGWGRLNARRVVQVFENNTYIQGSISQGINNTHSITVPVGVTQVKVMVYWNDYEGSTSSSMALVNNIDMTITDPSSSTLLPYVLDPSPNVTSLNTPATNGVDNLNNMEQIVINTPTSGNYTVNISGTSIPQGPQSYYVIYEFITDEIVVTYPAGGEGFVPGELERIRWDASNTAQSFTVDYSLDNGGTWTQLATPGGLTRQVSFIVPNVVTGQALVRVSRNGVSGQSILPFSIIGVPQNIVVSSSCPSSFELTWDSVAGATSYEVSILGNQYMDSVMTVNTTTALLTGYSAIQSNWVSVKAKTTDAVGERAYAIEKMPGIWNCILDDDIGISLENPGSSVLSSCIDYSSTTVTVKLVNRGIVAASNIDLNLKFNQGSTIQETYFGVILPGDSNYFSFSQPISISSGSNNDLEIWKLAGDDNPLNDSIITSFNVYNSQGYSLPYVTDFQNQNTCSTAQDCGATVCSLSNWINAENGKDDDVDFRVHVGGTPSSGTGPAAGHTNGSGIDKYLYLEASGACEFQEAQLLSPCFDLSQTIEPVARIWYNMNGTDMGELHFDVYANNRWNIDVISAFSGNQGVLWKEAVIDLSAFAGQQNVIIRFRGITGGAFRSDLALDDFTIIDLGSGIVADSMVCYSNSTVVSNSMLTNATNYIWDFGAGASPSTANSAGPHTISYSSVGLKNVTLSVSVNGVVENYSKTINVVDLPDVSFTYDNPNSDGKVWFTNTSNNSQAVSWDFDNGGRSTMVNPSHTYSMGGAYNVMLTATNVCGSENATQTVDVGIVGVNDLEDANLGIELFPNPANDKVTVSLKGNSNASNLQLLDLKGQEVFMWNLPAVNNILDFTVDVSSLPRGVYLFKWNGVTKVNYKKVVIQ